MFIYSEGGKDVPQKIIMKANVSLKIIPKYRERIDTHKLCQVIILVAKSNVNAHEKTSEETDK